jgi:hypothetical protein
MGSRGGLGGIKAAAAKAAPESTRLRRAKRTACSRLPKRAASAETASAGAETACRRLAKCTASAGAKCSPPPKGWSRLSEGRSRRGTKCAPAATKGRPRTGAESPHCRCTKGQSAFGPPLTSGGARAKGRLPEPRCRRRTKSSRGRRTKPPRACGRRRCPIPLPKRGTPLTKGTARFRSSCVIAGSCDPLRV